MFLTGRGWVWSGTDPRSVREVYRCRSSLGLPGGYGDFMRGCDYALLLVSGRSFLYRQILSMVGAPAIDAHTDAHKCTHTKHNKLYGGVIVFHY